MMRVRFLLAVLLGVLAGGAGLLAPATAHADSTDRVTTWEVAYVVDTEGAVHVTETMTWDFTGVWETRHGIERDLIIREP